MSCTGTKTSPMSKVKYSVNEYEQNLVMTGR